MTIKAVVFDWAGTMIDFGSRAPVIALLRVFAAAGVAITEAEARTEMGRAKRDHIRLVLASPRIARAWGVVHGAAPNDDDTDRLYDAIVPEMRAAARGCVTLIPGAAAIVAQLRAQGTAIGSCTGYTRDMMADILPLAAAQGYAPDVLVCSGETKAGRPSPLMLWQNLVDLGTWPAAACVKVDDAAVGIEEGKNAGTWTVGITASGNGVGLSAEALAALPVAERSQRIESAATALLIAGADYVIESVADLAPVLAAIAFRIRADERPQ